MTTPIPSHEDLDERREVLANARRATQAKLLPLAGGGMVLRLLLREQPWLLVAYVVLGAGLAIRWIVRYRRLQTELGLAQEYDELDENAAWGGKLLLVLFGVFGVFFVLLFLLLQATGKH